MKLTEAAWTSIRISSLAGFDRLDLPDARRLSAGERAAQHRSHRGAPAWRRLKRRGSSMGTRRRYCWWWAHQGSNLGPDD
jgi:hypothetical protein